VATAFLYDARQGSAIRTGGLRRRLALRLGASRDGWSEENKEKDRNKEDRNKNVFPLRNFHCDAKPRTETCTSQYMPSDGAGKPMEPNLSRAATPKICSI
jgi:hypothetical protein